MSVTPRQFIALPLDSLKQAQILRASKAGAELEAEIEAETEASPCAA